MADRPQAPSPVFLPRPGARPRSGQTSADHSLLGRAQSLLGRASGSTKLVGFLALAVTLSALLVLAGVTLTVAVVALVVFSPLLLLTSPLWLPVAVIVFFSGVAWLAAFWLAVASLGAGTWAYRYFTGRHPVGAHRVDDARGRFADMASHARGYYARVKDAAPGA